MAFVATTGAALFFALALLAIASWLFGGDEGFLGADTSCENNQFSCGALLELVTTLLAGAIAYVSFQYWRAYRVVRTPLKEARREPWKLVPTSTEMKDIVGREGICDIIEDDLCQKDRRPQILVAGVGEGKTAVLVRLTSILVERGAVPVPLRLRDATTSVDFVDLAKKRFQECVEPQILSEDEGDKVWRKFFNDGRIVVLADGLDEAMHDSDAREPAIRAGVEQAAAEHLPLVIASRPDEALENLDAALVHLEPLSSGAAIRCIRAAHPESSLDVDSLVEEAGIAEAPLFLHIARELHAERRLDDLSWKPGQQLSIRIELLDRWCKWLLQRRGVAQTAKDREAALEALQGMACHALAHHSLEVDLDKVRRSRYAWDPGAKPPPLRRVARVGLDMELIDWVEGGIRFRHSIMQAYLGAQRLPAVLFPDSVGYLDTALKAPSRELLIALAICCQGREDDAERAAIRDRLEEAARVHKGPVALDLLAAAYQIDTMITGDSSASLTESAKDVWSRATTEGPLGDVKADEAKLRAISRMGKAGRETSHAVLWHACLNQEVYGVRLAAAQTLAGGGGDALRAIEAEVAGGDLLRRELAGNSSRDAVRKGSLLGWILPTLLDSCSQANGKAGVDLLRRELDGWVAQAEQGLHLGVESCFAQGFKHAANRLPGRTDPAAREYLIGLAQRLLGSSTWWYTRLCLLHAVTLWALDRKDAKRHDELVEIVEAAVASEHHPYVRHAGRMCRTALRAPTSGDAALHSGPSRYIWIDETGVVTRIGSRDAVSDPQAHAGLWIPPAVGWHTLAWQARWLVAEVLLYLNLIEGGEFPSDPARRSLDRTEVAQAREQRRQDVAQLGAALPACIARTRDRAEKLLPGHGPSGNGSASRCTCGFGLCPYAERGERLFRGEMSETFCREQKRIVRGLGRSLKQNRYDALLPVPRGKTAAGRLQRFWTEMESRVARIGV